MPSENGFAFTNDFSGEILPGGLGKGLGLPSRFGLCGGMSFAAADYYLAGKAMPTQTSPPAQGTELYTYIYGRQAASNGVMGSMGLKFVEWMQLSDEEVRKRTAEELVGIVETVKRGEPVVIGEVLQGAAAKGGKAWENHQVLAYGLEEGAGGGGEMRIRIYDPNFPRKDDVAIRVRDDGYARVGGGRREMPIRGFFRMGYEAAQPR